MNQQKAFTVVREMKNAACFSERSRAAQTVVCPKPRRIGPLDDHHNAPFNSFRWLVSNEVELSESKTELDILDIILTKDGCDEEKDRSPLSSSPPFFCGSPPGRVSNPLTQDVRFRDEHNIITPLLPVLPPSGLPSSSSPPARNRSYIRGGFGGGSPMVRIEGFDCLDRDRRNCSIPTLA